MTSDILQEDFIQIPILPNDGDFLASLDALKKSMIEHGVNLTTAIQGKILIASVMESIDRYIAWKMTYAKQAAACYRVWIKRFYEMTGATETTIDGEHFVQYSNALQEKYSVGSVQFALIALKDHCKWLESTGISKPPYELIKRPKGQPKHYKPIKREDYLRILTFLDPMTPYGLRNMVLFLLFWDCGIRVGEMASLRISDLDTVDCSALIISEKSGGKQRRIFWSPETNGFLKKHIEVRKQQDNFDALFIAPQTLPLAQIDTRSIQRIIKLFSEKAGCKITPHSLRTTWATERYRNGLDLKAIQWGLGHANMRTTQIYVQPEDSEMEAKLRGQLA